MNNMTMTFDGLGRFHLGFVDPKDNHPYDFMFSVEDTAEIYHFLQVNQGKFLYLTTCEDGVLIEMDKMH